MTSLLAVTTPTLGFPVGSNSASGPTSPVAAATQPQFSGAPPSSSGPPQAPQPGTPSSPPGTAGVELSAKELKEKKKKLHQHIKASSKRDITDWCTKNMPCPEEERPVVTLTEFVGVPPKMSRRDVRLVGLLPFDFANKELSDWTLELLDLRRVILRRGAIVERPVCFDSASLTRAILRGSDCSRTSFRGCNAEMAVFNSARLNECCFAGATLRKASFQAVSLIDSVLSDVNGPGANFMHSNLERADLSDGWFCSREYYEQSKRGPPIKAMYAVGLWCAASFTHCNLKSASLMGTKLCGVDLSSANLGSASLHNADLRHANLAHAKLCGANLSGANLAGVRGLEKADLSWAVVLGGVAIDQDLSKHKDGQRILTDQASVEKWVKEKGDLSEINFNHCNLSNFNFTGCSLVGCKFRWATLHNTCFSRANLTSADFSECEMYGTDMSGATLCEATFNGAQMRSVNLSAVDLNGIKDALLRAKSLQGCTCTMGTVPVELKARGLIDADQAGTQGPRLDDSRLAEANNAVLEAMREKREQEKLKRAAEEEKTAIDNIDSQLLTLTVPPGVDVTLVRLRLLKSALRERMVHGLALDLEEAELRWADRGRASLGVPSPNVAMKKVYMSLISENVKDEKWLINLWRRTRDVKAFRMGSLEDLCIESMMRTRESWRAWARPMERQLATMSDTWASPDYMQEIQYLADLFKCDRTEEEEQREEAAHQPAPSSPQLTSPTMGPQARPPTKANPNMRPPPPNPSRNNMAATAVRPTATWGVLRNTAPPAYNIAPAVTTPMPAGAATSKGVVMQQGLYYAAPNQPQVPSPLSSPPQRQARHGNGFSVSALTSPPLVPSMPGLPPPAASSPMLLSPAMGPAVHLKQAMSPSRTAPTPTLPYAAMGIAPAQSGYTQRMAMQGISKTAPNPNTPGLMQAPPFTGKGNAAFMPSQQSPVHGGGFPPGLSATNPPGGYSGVAAVGTPPRGSSGGSSRQQVAPQAVPVKGGSGGSGGRMMCLECHAEIDKTQVALHQGTCSMRRVMCKTCRYSMRFVHWDNHNTYCGVPGTCPVCHSSVKDNVALHMYTLHMQHLIETGFFKGIEPPTKSK